MKAQRGLYDDRGEPMDDVASWPRLKAEAKVIAKNPILATELGRLAYFEKIKMDELDAGKEWNRLVHAHRRLALGAPLGNPKVSSFERGFGREAIDLDALPANQRDIIQQEIKSIQDRYDRAFCRVVELFEGVKILRAVNSLCIEDQVLTYDRLVLARKGLKALAKHFGFGRPKITT